jgi:hypothetical protein
MPDTSRRTSIQTAAALIATGASTRTAKYIDAFFDNVDRDAVAQRV